MAHYPSDIRRQRILREQNEILAQEQRIEEARRTRDAAVYAFERAQAVMNDAVEQLSAMCARCETAREELTELRLSYRRDLMETLPLDILGCIFEEVVALPPGFIECFQYNECYQRDHAFAPFDLAAVCRRWRTQALRQPFLWTYISTPSDIDDDDIQKHRQRIDRILHRSKSCPLDILISWTNCAQADRWDASPSLGSILHPLLSCALRWRTFELSLPVGVGKAEYTYALNGPLPSLLHFRFISIEEIRNDAETTSFPYAPRLTTLAVWGPNAVYPTPLGLASLRSLRLWYQLSLAQIIPLLSAVSPTLDSLAIGLEDDAAHLSDIQLELPKLKTLTLDLADGLGRVCQQLGSIRMPVVEHLLLPGNSIFADLLPIVDCVAATTRTLTLGDKITPQHIDVVGRLASVRTLVFDDFNEAGEPENIYTVQDTFFAALARAENADVWPNLERVELRKAGTLELGSGSGVLSFVRARTRRDADTPCRLRAFDVPDKVPEWLKAEVARLLQD